MGSFADILMAAMLPVLVLGSAFASGSETALFSLTRHQRSRLSRAGTVAAGALDTLLSETRALLVTLLLLNMTINVSYFVISTVLLTRLHDDYGVRAGVLAFLSLTPLLLLIILGEVTPKMVAARNSRQWSLVVAVPLLVLHRLIGPLRSVTTSLIVTPLARLIAPPSKPPPLSAHELDALLELSRRQGGIDRSEEFMLQQVLELSQLKVKDLMTPRVDVVAADVSRPVGELLDTIRNTRHGRIPVYEGDIDHVVGVVHAREFLVSQPESTQALCGLVRQVTFVPEVQRADQLLIQFRKSGTTIAVVVDEYGGTAGVVTLQDVVEQMVGDIAAPYEPTDEPEVQPVGEGCWRVSAHLGIHEWIDSMGRLGGFGEAARRAGISTVGGLVTAKLGRVARAGDRVCVGPVQIEVESVRGLRVQDVLIRVPSDTGGAGGKHDQAKGGAPA